MKKQLVIKVTWWHIFLSKILLLFKKHYPVQHDPISVAVKRHLDKDVTCHITKNTIRLKKGTGNHCGTPYTISPNCRARIVTYDTFGSMRPFEFTITLDSKYLKGDTSHE